MVGNQAHMLISHMVLVAYFDDVKFKNCGLKCTIQGFSYLSEVGARGLLNFGKYHLSLQNWEN